MILKHVVSTLDGSESRTRAQALKALTSMIEAGPDILGNVSTNFGEMAGLFLRLIFMFWSSPFLFFFLIFRIR